MRLEDLKLSDWQEYGSTEWVKNQEGKLFGPVSIVKVFARFKNGYAWYPIFHDRLAFLQTIYDHSTNYKEFDWNCQKEAMDFVDQFLLRLDKLKAFM